MGKIPASNSFFGWLGRQVGHVKKAVQPPEAPQAPAAPAPTVLYRKDKVEEQELPDQPGVKLRRTTIDEVIVDPSQRTIGEKSTTSGS